MSRYDGLIIPRSYSEYINKTDAATLQQALQLSGVLSDTVQSGDNKAVRSKAVNTKLSNYLSIIADAAVNTGSPLEIPMPAYSNRIVAGFVEGVGAVLLAIRRTTTSITVVDLISFSSFSSQYLTITLDVTNNKLVFSTIGPGNTRLRVWNLMHY